MSQHILCSAVHYRSEVKPKAGPINIDRGLVFCGRRHNDCMELLIASGFDAEKVKTTDLGFLTSDNRFVSRRIAWAIAKRANQIEGPNKDDESNILTSEDLYWGDDK